MKTDKLLFALKLAQPCVVSIDLIPVLQHFCFDKERLFAYDEVSAIVVGLDTKLHCALRGDTLLQLVSLAGEEVSLQPHADKVVFESGSTVVDLPLLPPEEFTFEDPQAEGKGTIIFKLTDQRLQALEACAAGVGVDPRFKAQTAVTLVLGKKPAMYAFDGTSLVKCTLDDALGPTTRQVLIPKSVCDQIKSIMSALEIGATDVTMAIGKEHMSVTFAHDEWNVKLIGHLLQEEADVAAYEKAIEEAADKLTLLPMDTEFAKAVDKVAVVVSNEVEKVCALDASGGQLRVSGEGSLGKACTTLKAPSKLKTSAKVDPERLLRYRGELKHIAIDKDRIAMYDSKTPDSSFLSYVAACY